MPLRITSLNSGLDTESIIAEMVKAQKTKTDKLKKEQTKLQWKQDTWKELNSKIVKLFTKTLNSMRFQGSYSQKKTTVSNPNYVSVVTGTGAANGVQDLEILKQAKQGSLIGSKLTGGTFTGSSKLSDLDPTNFGAGTSGEINITSGGTTRTITVDENTTISDFVTQLKESGIVANFDEKNQRLFINAKDSGEQADFSITASDVNGSKAIEALGINASLSTDDAALALYQKYAAYYIAGDRTGTLAGMQSMIDSDVAARVAAYKASNESSKKSMDAYDEKIQKIKDKDNYDPAETVDSLTGKIDTLKAAMDTATEDDKVVITEKIAKLNAQLADVKQINAYETEKGKLQDVINNNNQYIDTDASGTATAKTKLTDEVSAVYYDRAEYAHTVMSSYVPGGPETGAKRVAGRDAAIKLNGAEFTSTKNTFEINGLTITVLGETSDKITISTQDDTDGIYDTIKSFLKEYNGIINEMDKLYNADPAKGYEPLTDEEKEAMSEKEAEKWEQKVKDAVLRRDDSVSSVSRELKSIMMAGVEMADGTTKYLSDYGINTLNYLLAPENEKNAYHIDNDQDDENTMQNPDKLRTAISTNPEEVMNFFVGLSQNLYSSLEQMTSRNEFRSYNTAYNDKLMKKQYDEYTTKIKKQEAKVKALEDKWYAKFSAMETAMSKLQSSQSAISGLLGG